MRVVTAFEYGPPEVLRVQEREAPRPKPHEVLVEVKAAGLNLMDTYIRRGRLPERTPPLANLVKRHVSTHLRAHEHAAAA